MWVEKRVRIFVVDDSPTQRARLREAIAEIENAEIVGEADSALDAIEGIRMMKPDFIILDIRLRAGSGLDVLYDVKKDLNTTVTVIVLTNYPYEQYRRLSMSMGADYFFHKATQLRSAMNVLRGVQTAEDSRNLN